MWHQTTSAKKVHRGSHTPYPVHTNMLNMFKSGLSRQRRQLVDPIVHIPQLNVIKTCLVIIETWQQGGCKPD